MNFAESPLDFAHNKLNFTENQPRSNWNSTHKIFGCNKASIQIIAEKQWKKAENSCKIVDNKMFACMNRG